MRLRPGGFHERVHKLHERASGGECFLRVVLEAWRLVTRRDAILFTKPSRLFTRQSLDNLAKHAPARFTRADAHGEQEIRRALASVPPRVAGGQAARHGRRARELRVQNVREQTVFVFFVAAARVLEDRTSRRAVHQGEVSEQAQGEGGAHGGDGGRGDTFFVFWFWFFLRGFTRIHRGRRRLLGFGRGIGPLVPSRRVRLDRDNQGLDHRGENRVRFRWYFFSRFFSFFIRGRGGSFTRTGRFRYGRRRTGAVRIRGHRENVELVHFRNPRCFVLFLVFQRQVTPGGPGSGWGFFEIRALGERGDERFRRALQNREHVRQDVRRDRANRAVSQNGFRNTTRVPRNRKHRVQLALHRQL